MKCSNTGCKRNTSCAAGNKSFERDVQLGQWRQNTCLCSNQCMSIAWHVCTTQGIACVNAAQTGSCGWVPQLAASIAPRKQLQDKTNVPLSRQIDAQAEQLPHHPNRQHLLLTTHTHAKVCAAQNTAAACASWTLIMLVNADVLLLLSKTDYVL